MVHESTHLTFNPAGAETRHLSVGVVTVLYNSEPFFDRFMQALAAQTSPPDKVILVDSGSSEPAFLERASAYAVPTTILRVGNVGVCVGNNMGWRRLSGYDYILFLNPDAFIPANYLEMSVSYMEQYPQVGMTTPTLLRYNLKSGHPLDLVDTTGVVRNYLGLIVERDQERPISALRRYSAPNEIPWLCTAVALCRQAALLDVVEAENQVFDESFFMYKDDTDLSWRVRRAGWKIVHLPSLIGYHCRGWQGRRSSSRAARLLSSRNEIKMCVKNHSPFVVVALVKYVLVRLFNV